MLSLQGALEGLYTLILVNESSIYRIYALIGKLMYTALLPSEQAHTRANTHTEEDTSTCLDTHTSPPHTKLLSLFSPPQQLHIHRTKAPLSPRYTLQIGFSI